MAAPPNVVVFPVDQMRWDVSGLHGNPLGLTPHFDRLARQHTHLATAVPCQPMCGSARGWRYPIPAGEGQPRGPQPAEYSEAAPDDLEHDPYELTNLIGMRSHARVAAAMQERLRRRMAAIGEPSPVIHPAPERGGAQHVVEEAGIPEPEGNVPT